MRIKVAKDKLAKVSKAEEKSKIGKILESYTKAKKKLETEKMQLISL